MNDENQCCNESKKDTTGEKASCCSAGSCSAAISSLDWQAIINQAKEILIDPINCWGKIKESQKSVKEIYISYLIPLTVLGIVAQILGGLLFGGHFSFIHGVAFAVVTGILHLALIFVGGIIFSKLATHFNGTATVEDGFRLIAYSFTAALVSRLLTIYPPIGILAALFGIYSLYTIYSGIPAMTGISEKRVPYFCVALVSFFIASFIINLVVLGALGLTVMTQMR